VYTADGDAAAATMQSFVHDAWPSMAAMLMNPEKAEK